MNIERLIKKCQENPWLKRGSIYNDYNFTEVKPIKELKDVFRQGNWVICQGFIYRNLAFINQVDAGDEWWTLKKFEDDELVAFESTSFLPFIKDGQFTKLINRLLRATKEQCLKLCY